MITSSHQTFSVQIKHLSSQTKFTQTNLLYIINGNVIKFAEVNQFSVLIIGIVLKYVCTKNATVVKLKLKVNSVTKTTLYSSYRKMQCKTKKLARVQER